MITKLYDLTSHFPKEEMYGLTSQMRRASISIASNIAEGKARGTRKDYTHFLHIARGSGTELEAQIEIAKRLPKTSSLNYRNVDSILCEVMKMLNALIKKLKISDNRS
ncbi:MAG: four helix bundle protein [Kiritimatiellales bacterium]|nr:four helix bundle protein [Kiritimatiellales bacterium]